MSVCTEGAREGSGRTWRTQYFPPFFFFKMSRASGSYPGAMIPSDTSREMILAVATSQVWERAMKSPNEDMRSAPEHSVSLDPVLATL